MSTYFTKRLEKLVPYVPGEQPRDRRYTKLNTNESPYPPSPYAMRLARQEAGNLNIYSDPTCADLVAAGAEILNIGKENILFSNGSDEVLNYAFMAFCDEENPAVFADISYGFYKVIADLNRVPFRQIPLDENLSLIASDYFNAGGTVVIANPNAPTGRAIPLSDIEAILKNNPDNVVIIDEAYIDFGGESAIPLIKKYDNLLVVQTFSKSRCLAGGRLGFAAGNEKLIQDLNTIKYSSNPYNVNRMTMAAGIGALLDTEYFNQCIAKTRETRAFTEEALQSLGFSVIPSSSNFIFCKKPGISGEQLYLSLKDKGVLVRHFNSARIEDYIRVTVGSPEEMQIFLSALKEILA